ncbi:MAG: hypothetical protein Q7Q71_00080 [Verrucomicrobiota bacterium JB023]|nr:hypothetical protein [Verrucomicrobiota bacterium JB023]
MTAREARIDDLANVFSLQPHLDQVWSPPTPSPGQKAWIERI